jgi:hypothetical protein
MSRFTALINSLSAPPLLFTIWLGANDAAISSVHVPLPVFAANLRAFVMTLLERTHAPRILLITPPPINVMPTRQPNSRPATDADIAAAVASGSDADAVQAASEELGPHVYEQKMYYAAEVRRLAKALAAEAGEGPGGARVGLCDVWSAVVAEGLRAQGRAPLPADELWCADMLARRRLPGCGLPLAEEFPDDMFLDRLHFGKLVSCIPRWRVVRVADVHRAIRS